MATASSDRLARDGGEQKPPASTPGDVGVALREAREGLGMTLADVRDRTGVAIQHLEAMEAMDLGRLPDQRTVLVAARRYSEVVGLDPSPVCETALRSWQEGFRPETASAAPGDGAWLYSPNMATIPPKTGGWPETTNTNPETHLEAFTQTAELPVIRNARTPYAGDNSQFANTGVVPVTSSSRRRRRFPPRWLQVTLDATGVLVLLFGAGFAVHHYEPQWLTDIHLPGGHPSTAARNPHSSQSSRSAHASHVATRSLVTQSSTTPGSVSVIVDSADYQVVISATQPCWVEATAPGSSDPVFEGVLQAGEAQRFSPAQGALTVELGASHVDVQVQLAGKIVQGWSFTPPIAPFTLNFTGSTGN